MARYYRLKRPVVIGVRWVLERWAPRVLKPAGWQAQIVSGGSRTFGDLTYEGHSPADAFWGFVRWMQEYGYTGTARITDC